jgi:hypothetical protein
MVLGWKNVFVLDLTDLCRCWRNVSRPGLVLLHKGELDAAAARPKPGLPCWQERRALAGLPCRSL